MQKFNRAAIRVARKHPRPITAIMTARELRDNTLCHPTARKVLAWGVIELFRKSCQPVVLRITETKAAFLPGYHPTPQGAQWFAAFGLDVNGRGTWVLGWAYVRGLPPEKAHDQIEVRLLADLACASNVPGVPVMEVRE